MIIFLISILLHCLPATGNGQYNTILFRVTNSEASHVSYLFGTHHAFGASFFDSLQNAGEALRSSKILIKENLNIPGHMSEDVINARTRETKWNKYLDRNNLQYVGDLLDASPVDLNKMTPPELQAVLSRHYNETVCEAKGPLDEHLTLDNYIGSLAEASDIYLVGLETTEHQINLINEDVKGMRRKVHQRRLTRVIERLRTGDKSNCGEVDWYRKLEIDYKLDEPCGNALILTDRNALWMKQITELLRSNNCFIAVGLAHLMFDCGLIVQLEKAGFEIAPIDVRRAMPD